MATPYVKSSTGGVRNKKVLGLARALRIKPAYALGHLHVLWHAVMEQQDDGDLTSWSDDMITAACDVPSDAAEFVRLLQSLRLLGYPLLNDVGQDIGVRPGTERLVHDWIEFAGQYLRGRYAKDHPERLKRIWGRHGLQYGIRGSPSDPQPEPNDSRLLTNQPKPTTQPPARAGSGRGAKLLAELEKPE